MGLPAQMLGFFLRWGCNEIGSKLGDGVKVAAGVER